MQLWNLTVANNYCCCWIVCVVFLWRLHLCSGCFLIVIFWFAFCGHFCVDNELLLHLRFHSLRIWCSYCYLSLPYHMGKACYRLALRPPVGPIHVPEITLRLLKHLVVFSKLQCSCLNSLESRRCYPNCFLRFPMRALYRVPPDHGKSWNLGGPFSRPGKSWQIAKVMESHGKWW